jgi:acid phosphatase
LTGGSTRRARDHQTPAARARSAVEFKAPERKKLMDQGYTVIVNVGDPMSDLEGGFAERTYKRPNPFYCIP